MKVLALALAVLALPRQDERVDRLIRDLESDSKDVRDKAVVELARIGKPALDPLRKAARSKDPEVRALAQQAIEKIEWGAGYEELRKHVRDRFEDGSTLEPLKLKGIQSWFPSIRFYDVAMPAAGAAAGVPGETLQCVYAVRKDEPSFHRVIVRGVLSPSTLTALIRKERIRIKGHDDAFDFATAFTELFGHGYGEGGAVFAGGGAARFEKTDEGWAIQSPGYGSALIFKTDGEGVLLDVATRLPQYGTEPASQKLAEERARLELEKIKLELEVLKRQLEELNRKK
jgi:hypothetical protein